MENLQVKENSLKCFISEFNETFEVGGVYLLKEGLQQNNNCSPPEIVLYRILDLAI